MSGYRIASNKLRTTRILSVKTESPTVRTFVFKDKQCSRAEPGQFLMLWIPGVDEIPLSIFHTAEYDKVSVVVKKVGEATEALHNKEAGEIIGVRGPFGNSFTLKSGRILMVSGGTGIAALLFLAQKLRPNASRLVFVTGAETRDELLFMSELKRIFAGEKMQVIAVTEDGSHGMKGLATTPLGEMLEDGGFDMIYTCGPERMMRKVFDLAEEHGVDLEASLERLMRCAIGLCGSCVVGRYRVCRDGPVFSKKQLAQMKGEFGILKRDFDGRKVPL